VRNVLIGLITGIIVGIIIGGTAIKPAGQVKNAGLRPNNVTAPQQHDNLLANKKPLSGPVNPTITTWRMANAFSPNDAFPAALAKRLSDQSLPNSHGTLNIGLTGPGELIAPQETFNAVRAGAIDAAFFSPGLRAENSPGLELFSGIPFGPSASEFMTWFYGAGGRDFYDKLTADQGVYSIICGLNAPRSSGRFKSQITTANDFKDMNISIQGLGARVLSQFGANVTDIPYGNVYPALNKNIINAIVPRNNTLAASPSINTIAPYDYAPAWQQPVQLYELLINLDQWKSLSPLNQRQINTICGDNVRFSLAQIQLRGFDDLKSLVEQGSKIQRLPQDMLTSLNKAWLQVAASEKNKTFQKIIKSLKTFREDYSIWQEIGALQ